MATRRLDDVPHRHQWQRIGIRRARAVEAVTGVPLPGRRPPAVLVIAVVAVAAGVIVRFVATSPLWLDEALSVNIAQLPVGRLPEALRHDGAPPLYYLVLHGWVRVVGTGDVAVRALSGVFAVLTLPLIWLAGRRLGGPWTGWAALVLLASSPFAVRYATEARMYSLVVLLVLVAGLSLATVLERRSVPAMVTLGLTCGLLLLTHYWSIHLLLVVGALLGLGAVRGTHRAGARRALPAMASGALLFLPWLPSFLFQAARTATPWSDPARPRALFDTVFGFAGGDRFQGLALGIAFFGLMALGMWGCPRGAYRIELDLRRRSPGLVLAVVAFATLVLAIAAARATETAVAPRYASVVFPVMVLLVALGASVLPNASLRHGALGLAILLGFLAVGPDLVRPRTNAGPVAGLLRADAQPGDVVAYCPDQLGPSVSRLLPDQLGVTQLTFPRATPPHFVDWVDYEAVTASASVGSFSQMLLERSGAEGTLWMVWSPNFDATHGTMCQDLLAELRRARPGEQRLVAPPDDTVETVGLVRYRAG